MTAARSVLVLALFAAATSLAGCTSTGEGLFGYSAQELYPDNVRTVAVEIFDNKTFYRDVEFDVTEALIKEIERRTPYKVTNRSTADTLLTGTVQNVQQRVLSRQIDAGIPTEVQVIVSCRFEWKDLRSGKVLRERGSITGTGEHVPTYPVSEPYEVARHTASQELARDIVSVMRRDW